MTGAGLDVTVAPSSGRPGHRVEAAPGTAQLVAGEVVDVLTAGPQPPGTVVLDGRDLSRWDRARRVRAGLVVLGEVVVAPDVSILDHLVAVDRGRAHEVLADAPLLAGRGDDPAGWLSGGERQVLGWLSTILARPSAVVLDVAGRGLDQPTLAWADRVVGGWLESDIPVLVHPGRSEEEHWARIDR